MPSAPAPLMELRQAQAERIARTGRVLLIVIIVAMIALLGRVVQLKLMPDARLAPAVGVPMSSRVELTRRADLLDREGRVMATSTVGYLLFIDPRIVADLSTIALDLAELVAADPAELDQRISARPESQYVLVDDLLEDWQVEAVRKANLKGGGLQARLVRHYPHGDLAAGIVGRVGFDHIGQAGFEHIFDDNLEPVMGRLTFLRDVHRQALWIDPADYQPGRDGAPVRLSIDLVIQEFAEKRLRQAVEEYNAGGGRMVVMDPRSGEILAMCDFLNKRAGWSEAIEDPGRQLHPALGRNRCVSDPYEPGSTFKPFIWSIATEMGKAHLDEVLPTPTSTGWRTPYGRLIRDTHYYGASTWRTVLIKSMNTGMAMIAERMTHREMQDAIRRWGFGFKTRCGIPGETGGIVTSSRQWKNYTQTSVSFGHEIAVTPLQMVRAFSAFARDGTLPELRITAIDPFQLDRTPSPAALAAEGRGGGSAASESAVPRRVVSEEIALIAREAMKGVMEEGTGRAAQSEKYHLFSKSGTAQLPRQDRKGYHENRYVSSFIAGAPYDEPRIVVLCVLDDPDRAKGHFGGAIAGPVVRDVIDQTLTYLGVPADKAPPHAAKALVSAE